MTDRSQDTASTAASREAIAPQDHHERVPEAAENMEHTLRRLNAEKAEKRAKDPGLYL